MNTPDFSFEKELWGKGLQFVGGCDEVGRGCFAGPLVAANVVFSSKLEGRISSVPVKINDSKKLTEKQRMEADKWIKANSISYGIGEVSVAEINNFGIKKATEMAMRAAFVNCSLSTRIKIEHLLIDAFYVPDLPELTEENQTPIVKGDSISFSIAAASIVAKVYRDDLMNKIGKITEFLHYDWVQNKGYGTKRHREAILKHGTTIHHRKQFVETFLSKTDY